MAAVRALERVHGQLFGRRAARAGRDVCGVTARRCGAMRGCAGPRGGAAIMALCIANLIERCAILQICAVGVTQARAMTCCA